MDLGKVIHFFFTLMSLTLTAGFLYEPSGVMLFIAASINLISTLMKLGANNSMNMEIFASSLVTDAHLIIAFVMLQLYGAAQANIVYSLAIGAAISNVVTLVLVIIEIAKKKEENV